MTEFSFAFGRTIVVDDLEYDFNNRCVVDGRPTLVFDIRRPTPDGRIYQGALHVRCRNRERIGSDRLKQLIRESRSEAAARDLQDSAERNQYER